MTSASGFGKEHLMHQTTAAASSSLIVYFYINRAMFNDDRFSDLLFVLQAI